MTSERDTLVQQIAQLQARLQQLDTSAPVASTSQLPPISNPPGTGRRSKKNGMLGPLPPALAAAPKRHIALLFSYEGWAHSGLAYQPPDCPTPLPTVEGELLLALEKARLIEPTTQADGFGCGFERCGRTDAGVSSSAQVINLWVRSDLEDPMKTGGKDVAEELEGPRCLSRSRSSSSLSSMNSAASEKGRRTAGVVELPYITLLNRHLPPSIRILAWSPVSSTFSSRFSCIWRHYKYFFSTSPGQSFLNSKFDFGSSYRPGAKEGEQLEWQKRLAAVDWKGLELDVERMRDAVQRIVGEHDYRNFCKVDPPKQLNTHRRTVVSASIDQVEGEEPDMFVLNLRGGAFLYNQVRHIVAILFLVGARLEPPSIVDGLLWTSDRTEMTEEMFPLAPGEEREVMDRKPGYEMADDLPLILWQCGFNSTELDWRIDNAPHERDGLPIIDPSTVFDPNGRLKPALDPAETFRRCFLEMNQAWTEARLKSIVLKHHLASLAAHAPPPPSAAEQTAIAGPSSPSMTFTPNGAGRSHKTGSYIPLFKRKRSELPETLNQRWAEGRGARRMKRREENQEAADALRVVNLAKKAAAKQEAERLAALKAEKQQ